MKEFTKYAIEKLAEFIKENINDLNKKIHKITLINRPSCEYT